MSLALAHKRRVQAHGPLDIDATPYSASTALSSPANAQKHLKLMQAALAQDLDRISALNSREDRQTLKRNELLPKYLDYVHRYRESGLNHANPVVMQVMVWLFDTRQFDTGLELALFAMGQGQSLPERFRRDVPTFVADEVIDWAEAENKAQRSPEPYLSALLPFVDGEWTLFERIPARYHKLIGVMAMERRAWAPAIEHFERATELYPEIGINTRLEGARKALRREHDEHLKTLQQP